MICLNISDIAIITVEGVDNRCITHDISKSEKIIFLENSLLEDRSAYENYARKKQYYK